MEHCANAGQTYIPFHENRHVPTLPYRPLDLPVPPLKERQLNGCALEKGWIIASQHQHFLPGVSSEMLDWFWANMEKCYYLWAPGSHKKFTWVKSPVQYGMERSIHMIAESCEPGLAVFGGEGVEIHRLVLADFFPCTTCLKHVICEGVYNDLGELVDSTIHMWEDCEGGCLHITATVANSRVSAPPGFIIKMLQENPDVKIVPNWATEHEDYEASQWPVFLPKLYELWKNHPDPSQNVRCNLEVVEENGKFRYVAENGPVTL